MAKKKGQASTTKNNSSVCAVIRMGYNDTSIAYGLATAYRAGIKTIFIVDPTRGKADYEKTDATVKELTEKRGVRFVYLRPENERAKMQTEMRDFQGVLTIPPDFYCSDAAQLEDFLAQINIPQGPYTLKHFAMAPVYARTPDPDARHWTDGLVLMLHMLWATMGFFVGWRLYRGTYMTLSVLRREGPSAYIAENRWRNTNCSSFQKGGATCVSASPPERSNMDHVLYLIQHENFGLRKYVFAAAFTAVIIAPFFLFFWIPPVDPETGYWSFYYFLRIVRTNLLTSGRLAMWVIYAIYTAYHIRTYFSGTISYWHAALLPLYALLFLPILFFAQVVWRGYGGKRPVFRMPPSTIPRKLKDALPQLLGDDDSEEDEEEEPEPPLLPPKREAWAKRKPATLKDIAKAANPSGDDEPKDEDFHSSAGSPGGGSSPR